MRLPSVGNSLAFKLWMDYNLLDGFDLASKVQGMSLPRIMRRATVTEAVVQLF